jgi:hypothetical protein
LAVLVAVLPAWGEPPPEPWNEFVRNHPRLAGLRPGMKGPVGTTPVPSREALDKFKRFVGPVIDPELTLDLIARRPRLLRLKATPLRIQVGDGRVLSCALLGTPPAELSLQGVSAGTTVLNLWFGDPEDRAKQTILSFLVRVAPAR